MRLTSSIILLTLSALASAANLQPPVNRTAGAHTQVHWDVSPNDREESWTLFLMDPAYAFGLYAILGTEIQNSLGVVDVVLPVGLDPSKDYILKSVKNDWVDYVLQESPIFHITAA
ncbi:hypothetical protein JR316_0002762 [Psilocybe cubensis]|uniref:Uncharacterized protein n=2 Tax=Psilocybe cubensis TaxID=181762 RepID=A0ACB8HDZ5_PSICU|nr:hypothetical protein JR316_0002762 [Psilocybe cubensis]KAH9485847.1 hypothetical protein JR316_0002762 [Psilocybe cubensis]